MSPHPKPERKNLRYPWRDYRSTNGVAGWVPEDRFNDSKKIAEPSLRKIFETVPSTCAWVVEQKKKSPVHPRFFLFGTVTEEDDGRFRQKQSSKGGTVKNDTLPYRSYMHLVEPDFREISRTRQFVERQSCQRCILSPLGCSGAQTAPR